MAETGQPGESCPHCGGELRSLGLLLCVRPDDGKRVCRTPLWCAACDRMWTRWADRDDALEPGEPLPASMRRSLRGGVGRGAAGTGTP